MSHATAEVLGLGLRGPAAATRAGRGGGRRGARAPRLRRRPRSSGRLGSRSSSFRPRGWSRPPRSPRSAGPIPTSAPRTPTGSPTATWCARSAGASTTRPTWWPTPPTRRSSSACSPGARRRTPRRSRSAAAPAWWAGWSRRRDRPAVSHRPEGASIACSRWTAVSRAARIQAGVTGPALEDQLRGHGLTLRHFPQSFEFSTLGGWIATRAGGHYATLYTHIDDFVESVRALTPRGWWESRRLPASGAGPSPDRMLIGSEGILGVITEAWMRVQDAPRFRESAAVLFDSFESGAQAVRALSQSGLHPSNCRLLDPGEAALTGAAPDGQAAARARLRVRRPRARPLDGARARALRGPRRAAARAAGGAAASAPPPSAASPRAPGATPSSRRPTCATRSWPPASSPRPSRPRSPGTASRSWSTACASACARRSAVRAS